MLPDARALSIPDAAAAATPARNVRRLINIVVVSQLPEHCPTNPKESRTAHSPPSSEKAEPEEDTPTMDRREFVKTASTAAGAIAAQQWLSPILEAQTRENNGMIYRPLGRTGERVSAIGLGGYHIGKSSIPEQDAIQLVRQAIDRGITFMDNCWDYNDGVSEVRMGKALAGGYRNKVFLMTKIDGRTQAA